MGGASLVKPPHWAPKRYIDTWKAHVHDDGTILNCAAFALTFMQLVRPDKNQKRLYQMTKELMQRMHWSEVITIDELQRYVMHEAKTKRLTVLLPRLNHQIATTFEGPDFVYEPGKADNLVYLVYDITQEHFAACQSPQQLFMNHRCHRSMKWCHTCLFAYNSSTRTCLCEIEEEQEKVDERKRRKRLKLQCESCGLFGGMCSDCASISCRFCGLQYQRDHFEKDPHRCIVFQPTRRKDHESFWTPEDGEETRMSQTKYKLWAYDLESGIQRIPEEMTMDFYADDDGSFLMEQGRVRLQRIEKAAHVVNLVVFRNVFDPTEEKIYFGADALSKFVMFMMNHNQGKNICVAHNGSGYDTRLVFEEAILLNPEFKIVPTARGCKFMQIQVGHTIFRDSMLHLKGSLANLAKDFFGPEVGLRKGHFPHLFNSIENYNYIGQLPDKKYFDLSFMIKNKAQLEEFNAWYAERSLFPWSFKEELVEYCKNDVLILAELMKAYHDILVDKFDMSPWFHATAPSYVHQLVIHKLSQDIELPERKQDPDGYRETISKLAWETYWGVLTPNEYWFARKALRGGRTEIRKVFHEVESAEWDRGVRIRYQDIVSMYPYVQVAHDYPVGLPTIEVYDPNYFPCFDHRNPVSGNVVQLECHCPIEKRRRHPDRLCRIVECSPPNIDEILHDDGFFGIVCASMTPPVKLFHPVLVTWDESAGKCIASLEPIKAGVFTSVEFKKALEKGYTLDCLHRLDRYHKRKGLWTDIIKDLYIEKMVNSQDIPTIVEQERLVEDYETFFGMGEQVQASFGQWKNNPAKKQTFKILLNSGWGKHAQRAVMPQTTVIDADAVDEMLALFKNVEEKTIQLQDFACLGDKTFVKHSALGEKTNPNLHHGYLPAAVFVPAYGRLMLWEQLNKLGKRVLMHDTDSIVYLYDPERYNIPEGDLWGQWSVEKFDVKNEGLKTFIGLGPKSYALEAANGKTMFKCKGVSIKLAHEALLNYEVMKKLVLDFLKEKTQSSTWIPQVNFVYRIGRKMITWKSLKEVTFKPEELKGYLHEDGILYPYRYCSGCIWGALSQRDHACLGVPPPYARYAT